MGKITSTKKSALLDQFLETPVQISTGAMGAIQGPDGEIIEVPLVIEGILLDYDQDFLLLCQIGRDALQLVRRDSVLDMKEVREHEEIMDIPGKPPIGAMN